MSDVRTAELLRQLDESASADRVLLARFVQARDQSAFEQLVRRHGPMVFGVCRRVAGHPQDAEDAFQAVFLVLAQKGAGVSDPDLLGNWLYGVAVRVSQKARRTALRRRAREVQVTAMREPVAVASEEPDDTGPILHAELAMLPAVFRDAIVLCDLRGLSRADAAVALGVPEGTLSSRLANGRKKLADRLARRGVALTAAAVPAAVGEARAVPVPESLITKTCGLAADAAAGVLVAAEVVRLTERGIDVRKVLTIGVLGAALAAAGVVFAARPDADPQKKKDPPRKSDPPAAKVEPGKPELAVKFTSPPVLSNRFDVNMAVSGTVRWNAAGTRLLVVGTEYVPNARQFGGNTPTRPAARVLTVSPWTEHALKVEEKEQFGGFLPDGDTVYSELREHHLLSGDHRLSYWERAVAAPPDGGSIYRMKRRITLPADTSIGYAFAPDGKTFRTVVVEKDSAGEYSQFALREVNAGTGEVVKTDEGRVAKACALSPDGKRLAFVMTDFSVLIAENDKKDARIKHILPPPDPQYTPPSTPAHVQFSPDGKRVVVACGFNWTHVLNADNLDAFPQLEGLGQSETTPAQHCFSADGRLIALGGSRWSIRKNPIGTNPDGTRRTQTIVERGGHFVGVWDTQTGKALKVWERRAAVAFSPAHPVLATIEPNGSDATRVGLWSFAPDE